MLTSYFSKTIISLLFALSILPVSGQMQPKEDPYDVFLLIGQSNMAGRGQLLPEDREPLDGVWILDDKGQIVPAAAPLNIYSSVRKEEKMQGMNPGWEFAQKIHRKTGRKILLVVNARGGTSLEQWMKNAPQDFFSQKYGDEPEWWNKPMPSLYDEAVRRARQAMQYGQLKAIIWHQGEGNSDPTAASAYLGELKRFVADLRCDLRVGHIPFIAGQICKAFGNAPNFNPEIARVGKVIENSFCVSSHGCESNPDQLHFSREGQIKLGKRYADIVYKTVYKNE